MRRRSIPTRCTTVLTLGTLLAGGVLGTDAFPTVQSQWSVSLETADDSDTLLAVEIIDDEYVSQSREKRREGYRHHP